MKPGGLRGWRRTGPAVHFRFMHTLFRRHPAAWRPAAVVALLLGLASGVRAFSGDRSLVAAADGPTTTPQPPVAAAPLVETPQHGMLFLPKGKTLRIWVVRLLPTELIYRDAEHADADQSLPAGRDLKAGVKLLSGDVFRIDPRSGRFNRYDELTGRFAAAAQANPDRTGDHAAPAGEHPGDAGDLHTEVAEGTGTDPAAALADALRNAVRQAVGVYVDSETLTNKEEVVSDKVLTFSDAFVVRFEELSRSVADGLVTIKVSAAIQAGKLMENLRAAKIDLLGLDGADLVASALTRKESKDAAADLLARKFAELPGTLHAEALPFKPLDYDARRQLLTVTYILRADKENYPAFLRSIEPLLDQAALAKTTITVNVQPLWSDTSSLTWIDAADRKQASPVQAVFNPGFRYGPNLARYADTWCLWLMTKWDANHRHTQWKGYALDVDLPRTLNDLTGSVFVQLDLLDAQGEVILTERHDPLAGMNSPAYWFGWARPRPRAFYAQTPQTWPKPTDCPTSPVLLVTFREPQFGIDAQRAVNVYMSPMCYTMPGVNPPILAPWAWQVRQIRITPADLARVQSIRAAPVLVPLLPAAAGESPK